MFSLFGKGDPKKKEEAHRVKIRKQLSVLEVDYLQQEKNISSFFMKVTFCLDYLRKRWNEDKYDDASDCLSICESTLKSMIKKLEQFECLAKSEGFEERLPYSDERRKTVAAWKKKLKTANYRLKGIKKG